jgi:hypothetical protein
VYFECDTSRTVSHLIEVRHLHQRRGLLPLGYSITGSGKGVDAKAFKIAAFGTQCAGNTRRVRSKSNGRLGSSCDQSTPQAWSAVEWIADTQLARPSVLLGLRHALAGILKALHLTGSEPQSRMWRDGNSYSATKVHTRSGPSSSMLSCCPKTPKHYRE